MPHAHFRPRSRPVARVITQALVLGLIPLGTAYAQSQHSFVRVTRDRVEISALRLEHEVRMTAPRGTVLEVFYVDGDRYKHDDSNWYWVLLPQDPQGSRPAGWIRGDAVEHVPPPVVASSQTASVTDAPSTRYVRDTPKDITTLEVVPVKEDPVVRAVPTARPVISDVVLNFQFGRSELTEEAKDKLASAVVTSTASARGMFVALEGHADWIGSETYNERLGLARAETVRRYLAEQLRIPASQISVVSYGENNPVASNTTREGRAHNRRVVIKVGA